MRHRFYGQNIDTPLSAWAGHRNWDQSPLGILYHQTKKQVYLNEIEVQSRYRMATAIEQQQQQFCWRVVDAYYHGEDNSMSYFFAFDAWGFAIPNAVFGVNWGGTPGAPQIDTSPFAFRPLHGQYKVLFGHEFMTAAEGGYSVGVLDLDWPSEELNFGMLKPGHQGMIILFRLFEFDARYPNDYEPD